ncbi:MAG: hypothetical protein JWO67_3152 [Streptosporangiaceae bacterium]|nr:hypothetical protein [Streptosporangiaceae bacterium]
MGFLILIGIGWAVGYMFEGKAAEYRAAQGQYRKQLNRRLRQQHPSWDKSRRARSLWWGARRNAAGHFAYQLRHGWSPAVADIRDGFSAARNQHQEWLQRRQDSGEPIPGLRNAIRAGWLRAKAKFQQIRGGGEQSDSAPIPETVAEPTSQGNGASVRRLHRVGAGGTGTTSTTGEPMGTMTGETPNIDTYRQHLSATEAAAQQRIEEAQAEIAAANQEISAHENTNNSLLSAGLGQETAGGMTDLMDAAMQRRSAAQTRLQAAEQSKANAGAARSNLRTQGHEGVEHAVQGATAKVGDTSFYGG